MLEKLERLERPDTICISQFWGKSGENRVKTGEESGEDFSPDRG